MKLVLPRLPLPHIRLAAETVWGTIEKIEVLQWQLTCTYRGLTPIWHSVLSLKALVSTFSVILKLQSSRRFEALVAMSHCIVTCMLSLVAGVCACAAWLRRATAGRTERSGELQVELLRTRTAAAASLHQTSSDTLGTGGGRQQSLLSSPRNVWW